MTISHIALIIMPLKASIKKYSFFGLFRFGPEIDVEIKVCCDIFGKITYQVIKGPKVNYPRVLGEKFDQVANEALMRWNDTRRKPKPKLVIPVTKPVTSHNTGHLSKSHAVVHRSIEGIIKTEALIPKEEVPLPPLPPKPYEKQKTIEYRETDVSFGDTSKIYGRQTRTVHKNDLEL